MISKQVFMSTAMQAIACMAGTAAFAQQSFTMQGRMAREQQGMVHLVYYTGEGRQVQDSAQVKDGEFIFKGRLGGPGFAQIALDREQQMFYLEEAAYMVKSDAGIGTARITGGQEQANFENLKALHQPIDEQMRSLMQMAQRYKPGDSAMQQLRERAKPLERRNNAVDSVFIANHPDSYLAWDLWQKRMRGVEELAVLEPGFLHFSERIRHSAAGEQLAAFIVKAKKLNTGQSASGFILKDTLGRQVALSGLKGKYVLVCFLQKNVMDAEAQKISVARMKRLFGGQGLYVLAAMAEDNPGYAGAAQCLLVGPDGKIAATRLKLDNELPYKIGKFIKPGAAGGEGDVYVGGEMVKYPKVDWIQGTPVTAFEKDKIYVVELWATWCKPCVAAMPHLNQLSQKFAGKITFVGQDVMEDDKEKVQSFVKQKGDGLTYRIAYGGGRGSDFDNKWIRPAGVMGIPQTFIIQNNKLVWQTHPDRLKEAILQLLIDKKFTIEAAEVLAEKN